MKWDPMIAAAKGAEYLDAVKPDWFRVVDTSKLDLGSEDHCILGQCFNGYFVGLAQLVPAFNGEDPTILEKYANRRAFALTFGFHVPESSEERGGFERLGLAWKALIRKRRRNRKNP